MKPYQQVNIESKKFLRTFEDDVDANELKWHFDVSYRIVTIVENNGWMLQMDNELPQLLKDVVFIPKNVYHRVIKGNGKLQVLIQEL